MNFGKLKVSTTSVILYFILGILKVQAKFVSPSELGIYDNAAVATIGPECAKIGSNMLKRNGSAVDAAIASLLCEGVVSLQSSGLGGGFFMTIFDAATNKSEYLDARETAPSAAHKDMYHGNGHLSQNGGLAVAVPGELLGYYEAHKKYGKLPWNELFEPSIELCEKGIVVTKYLENGLKGQEDYIRAEPTLYEILVDPKTNKLYAEGDRIKRPVLKETLKKLAEDREKAVEMFYRGSMRDDLVKEIQGFQGIITREDFENYRVNWTKPLEAKIGNMTMYTAPPPGSGAILVFMINLLEGLIPVKNEDVMWQRFVETFKWAYAKRTELGDPRFVAIDNLLRNLTSQDYADKIRKNIKDNMTYNDPQFYGAVTSNKEDHGTIHVSVLAPDGSAVSATATINLVLGAKIRSRSTGIIFNDEMDDFSSPNITNGFDLPPSPNNFIEPNKRPLSSMAPTIVVNENNKVQLVIGGAGGTKITSTIALTTFLHLYDNYSIKEAIDVYRLHHQLFPMMVQYETNFSEKTLNYLRNIGHDSVTFSGLGSAITAVSQKDNQITANSDYRREGKTSGF